jgi:DNA-binding CsgD family transcriptional regulator
MSELIPALTDLYENSSNYVFYKNCRSEYLYANQKMREAAEAENIQGKTDFDLPWKHFAKKYRADDTYAARVELIHRLEPFVVGEQPFTVRVVKMPILVKGYVVGILGQTRILTPGFNASAPTSPPASPKSLTKRQQEILLLVLRGQSARQIADTLCISKRTVDTHIETLKNVCHCQSKSELVAYGFKIGLHLVNTDRLQ